MKHFNKIHLVFIVLISFTSSLWAQNPGDVIISEIMQNPSAVSDANGEWFELYNTTNDTIDLLSWSISDQAGLGQQMDSIESSLELLPNAYVTLANNGDPSTNGGYMHDYIYSGGFVLTNSSDEIILKAPNGIVIDSVYYDNGITFPDPNGNSMSLDPFSLNGSSNDNGLNWCAASESIANGDFGSPGMENAACNIVSVCANYYGDIIITEIMNNPIGISDGVGEWFEVYNTSSTAIDMSGWTISDDGSNFHTISSLIVAANSFAVLARDDSVSSYGVNPDYIYNSFSLGNGEDEIIITCHDGIIIDELSYDDGLTFPDPNGYSMTLNSSNFDVSENDIGSNWCTALSVFDQAYENYGTPGLINDACDSITLTCVSSLYIAGNIQNSNYQAVDIITTDGSIGTNINAVMNAGDFIELQSGFNCAADAEMHLFILSCN